MRIAGLLRLMALGLALLCVLDPPVVVVPQVPIAVDVVEVRSPLDASRAQTVARELSAALDNDAGVRLHTMPEGASVPCDAFRPCVVIGMPSTRVRMPADREGRTYVIALEPMKAGLAITGVSASASHPSAEGLAVVGLTARGLTGQETRVALLDGGAVVGEASHRWGDEAHAEVAVPWWPMARGRRTLTARVSVGDEDSEVAGDEWTTSVDVGAEPWSVIVHERRPSWATTFARRALALDPRFALTARTDLAPRVAATDGSSSTTSLGDASLDAARVVIVGAPDTLTGDDVTRLERFARERGGAIVLAPDQPFSGPVTRLLTARWRERIRPEPFTAAGLTAREWLVADGYGPFDEVIGAQAGDAVILASPMGAGRLVVVGALDAWRTRGPGEGFDRFWRQTVAGLAAAAPPAVAVVGEPAVGWPGDEVRVRVQVRGVRLPPRVIASASLTCDDGERAGQGSEVPCRGRKTPCASVSRTPRLQLRRHPRRSR
jgi:hypothetical protein